MKRMTIKETLSDNTGLQADFYRVYVIRDGETVFYVGQSQNTYNRLLDHLGIGGRGGASHVGKFIQENTPASDDWLFEQYTVEDCREFVLQDRATLPHHLQDFYVTYGHHYTVDDAEYSLIRLYHPCLNTTMNPSPNPLPEKYTPISPSPNISSGHYLKVYENPLATALEEEWGI